MIRECLEVFEEMLQEHGDDFVIQNYLPKDGTYVLVEMGEQVWKVTKQLDILFDKKKGIIEGQVDCDYPLICYLDYHSKLLEMNKPIDPKKIIHSCHYYALSFKKENLVEGKVTNEILDGYYEVLRNPEKKYESKKKQLQIYQELELELGEVDKERIDSIQAWIKEHLFELAGNQTKKNYMKIFFVCSDQERSKRCFEKEGRRYLIPNIYNSPHYNRQIDGETYGLPNNNLGMNSKKPYLENKTRKEKAPYLLNQKQVLLQNQFYEYLSGLASAGYLNVFVDFEERQINAYKADGLPTKMTRGYFLRLKKGKEVEIHYADTVVDYNPNLNPSFVYKAILETDQRKSHESIYQKSILHQCINEVLFSKYLAGNYFTPVQELQIKDDCISRCVREARGCLQQWFYLDHQTPIISVLDQTSKKLILNTITNGYGKKAKEQLNLRWSLMDYFIEKSDMEGLMNQVVGNLREHIQSDEEWDFADDEEYYFAVGQMAAYFLNKSKASKKTFSMALPIINAKEDGIIKKRMGDFFKKYAYDITINSKREKRLYSHIMLYKPVGKVNAEMMIAGVTADILIYEKKEKKGEVSNG